MNTKTTQDLKMKFLLVGANLKKVAKGNLKCGNISNMPFFSKIQTSRKSSIKKENISCMNDEKLIRSEI